MWSFTALLRRRLRRLLSERDRTSRVLNLRGVVERIEYWPTGSQLESSLTHLELASKEAELALERELGHLTDDRERDKAEADIALKASALQADTAVKREQMATDIEIARMRPKPSNGKKKPSANTEG